MRHIVLWRQNALAAPLPFSRHGSFTYSPPGATPHRVAMSSLEATMRVAADGYIDLSDGRRVRTPGYHDHGVEPVPEEEALAFLLSHTFRGHRRIIRPMSLAERKRIRLALWADSVSERMALVDRVWRSITERVDMVVRSGEPELVQVVRYGTWAYPLYADGDGTRVIPHGGMPLADVPEELVFEMDQERKTA